MNVILEKAIKGQPVTDDDIRLTLAEICEQTCGQCDSSCPVYELNGNKVVCRKGSPRCVCLRNGGVMLNFIREYYISIGLMRTPDQTLAAEMTQICERVHASCDSGCPVWVANGGKAPMRGTGRNRECMCFKGGTEMLKFLRKVEARNRAKEEACIGEELWQGVPKDDAKAHAKAVLNECRKCPGGFRAVLSKDGTKVKAKHDKVDKQTEGWIKVIRGKRK